MKTTTATTATTKTYLASRTELVSSCQGQMIVPFKGDDIFVGSLAELAPWLKARPFADVPERCLIDNRRHGIFFVLYATSERMAAAMSAFAGYEVPFLDGITFASRSALKELVSKLKRVGIIIPPSSYRIMVTSLPYEVDIDRNDAPKPTAGSKPAKAQVTEPLPF